MTQTTAGRIDYAKVRPGMTVSTYSGQPIEVTDVRHVTFIAPQRDIVLSVVVLSGWVGRSGDSRYVENCSQLPGRTTRVRSDTGAEARFWATIDDDAALHRTAHSYSTRYLELDLNIRI